MNGTNCNNDERVLLPYPVILAATKGDPSAMSIVVQLSLIHIFLFVLFFNFRYLFRCGGYNPQSRIAHAVEQRVKLSPPG